MTLFSRTPEAPTGRAARTTAASLLLHAAVIAGVVLLMHVRPRYVAPYRLPGSPHGSNFLVSYLPDRAPEQSASARKAVQPAPPETHSPLALRAEREKKAVPPATENTHASPDPNAATGADALGRATSRLH